MESMSAADVPEGELWITGGSGFLGKYLAAVETGSPVICTRSSEVDLLDLDAVCGFLRQGRIRKIIHAAGFVGGIGLNLEHPGRMATDNLRMGLNVLEAAARQGACRVVIVSTVCVYPERASVPTKETEMFDGFPSEVTSFYGIAKRTLLTVAEGLSREFGLEYSYVIPTNLYGPGDHFEEEKSHVIPALIRRVVEAKESGQDEVVVWGDGTQTRDLLFVEDAARGIHLALQDRALGQVFNLGSGQEVSVRQMAETICELVGYPGRLTWDTTKPGGAPRRALDPGKAQELLGFEPRIGIREGLGKTIEWYLQSR
ncbi:MAG: NAD-dependent epimerase/dehydratase family protein [Armatimonadetes bacterium]|nr:NAD-dependent epimerase/dehydratase family protein [Armatimonadota bacterium]